MKLCSKFHSSRVTDLRQLWKELSKLDNLIKDPLFLEYINETLMTEHVKKSFEAVVQTVEVPELNDAELNALSHILLVMSHGNLNKNLLNVRILIVKNI